MVGRWQPAKYCHDDYASKTQDKFPFEAEHQTPINLFFIVASKYKPNPIAVLSVKNLDKFTSLGSNMPRLFNTLRLEATAVDVLSCLML